MRCFISVNLPEELKKDIYGAAEKLRDRRTDVKWVAAENLHITLKFLGETSEEMVHQFDSKLSSLAGSVKPFRISLRGIGLFPDSRRPRVVWIDILDAEPLKRLQEAIERTALSLGFAKEERPFSPHLTIGRVRSSSGKGYLIDALETLKERDFGNIDISAFSLMKSDLRPAGAQYTTLHEFRLKEEER